MVQEISSSLQLVHGGPHSNTLHRTFRDLHDWQAVEARFLIGLSLNPSMFVELLFLPTGMSSFTMLSRCGKSDQLLLL
jgi:hypothetical protein